MERSLNVSVVIPVYNAAPFVAEAVRSALDQPETAEVILVEDGSTDDSLATCRRLAEEHATVRVVQHAGGANRGAAESRQLGIDRARSTFVAFLDADDVYLPGRFRAASACLARDPGLDGVYDAVAVDVANESAASWWQRKKGYHLATMTPGIPPEQLFLELVHGRQGFLQTNGVLVRRSLFERAGGFASSLWLAEDLYTWLRLAAVGRFVGGSLEEPVALYRIHGQNTVIQHFAAQDQQRQLMWLALASWLHERRMYGERLHAVLQQAALPRVRYATKNRSRVAQRMEAVGVLWRLVRRRPALAVRPEFARTVGQVAGLHWLKRQTTAIGAGVRRPMTTGGRVRE